MEAFKDSDAALGLADTISRLYQAGQQDYSLEPIVAVDRDGAAIGRIKDGDGVIFCCRRGEREIQLTDAFTDRAYPYFTRPFLDHLIFVPLTLYHEKFKHLPVAFAPPVIQATLGEKISKAGKNQLRVAESEKFAHITFFLNGGRSKPFDKEFRVMVPSVKGVSFAQIPEMSLAQVVQEVINGLRQGYDFIAANFANGDVIGHTTNFEAKIKCAECVDENLKLVVEAGRKAGYTIMITADHGNLEILYKENGSPHVAHTDSRVPFVIVGDGEPRIKPRDGKLADIAPTILAALGIERPVEMNGSELIDLREWGQTQRVLLIILDGWGFGENDENNPIYLGKTPFWDELITRYPSSLLNASGEYVGLKPGKAGNSEAGHLNIGGGRVVLQDDVRLDQAMEDGTFAANEKFLTVMRKITQTGSDLHLIGLLSEKSSHGSIEYPLALLKLAKEQGLHKVFLHMIIDGRSTEPGSAPVMIENFNQSIDEIGIGQVVTAVGRGFALDRDGNYEKTRRTYEALVEGAGHGFIPNEKTQYKTID